MPTPYSLRCSVLETVTVDLFIIRSMGLFLRRFPSIVRVRARCLLLPGVPHRHLVLALSWPTML